MHSFSRRFSATLLAIGTLWLASNGAILAQTAKKWVNPNARLAVILIDFRDVRYSGLGPRGIERKLFGTERSLREFWKEVSNDRFIINGSRNDVFRVLLDTDSSPCNRTDWANTAMFELEQGPSGFHRSNYDLILYSPGGSCSALGMPWLDPPGAFVQTFTLRATAHELGHALGLSHSSRLTTCTTPGDPTSCDSEEYGDLIDVMGGTPSEMTYNQQKRGQLGWLDPSETLTITNSGFYDLFPIQRSAMSSLAVRTLRIPRVVSAARVEEYYYIELRQPTGLDRLFFDLSSPLANGTLIRLGRDYSVTDRTYLIPARHGTDVLNFAPWIPDPNAPAVFQDVTTQTVIKTHSVNQEPNLENSYAVVEVIPGNVLYCVYGPPTANVPTTLTIARGGSASFDLLVTNGDSVHCPRVTILGRYDSIPPDWDAAEPAPGFGVTLKGAETSPPLTQIITPGNGANPGTHTIHFVLRNEYTGQVTSYAIQVTVT